MERENEPTEYELQIQYYIQLRRPYTFQNSVCVIIYIGELEGDIQNGAKFGESGDFRFSFLIIKIPMRTRDVKIP